MIILTNPALSGRREKLKQGKFQHRLSKASKWQQRLVRGSRQFRRSGRDREAHLRVDKVAETGRATGSSMIPITGD